MQEMDSIGNLIYKFQFEFIGHIDFFIADLELSEIEIVKASLSISFLGVSILFFLRSIALYLMNHYDSDHKRKLKSLSSD